MPISPAIQTLADRRADDAYDDLRAVVFNGTLKRSPEASRTDDRLAIPRGIFERVGVAVDEIRTVDHEIPPGVWPDMTRHGYPRDDFPAIHRELVGPADIVILAGPIWLGDQSSQTRKIIERLYAYTGLGHGQWSYSVKVGGVVTAGDADGGERVSAQALYALRHIGLTVPPRSSAPVSMTWTLLQLARALKDGGGVPADDWDLRQPGHPNREHRARAVRG
jgi:multimeric flavodoxin WrbA